MHRFFLPEDWMIQDRVTITGSLVHRLRNVLRLEAGEHITVLDNSGWEYEVELKALREDRAEGTVISKTFSNGEPAVRITLYQALLKSSNFEFVLQKCTEIGVSGFVPIACERCVAVKPDARRLTRWQKVILEAAQQSKRGKLPVLHHVTQFKEACELASGVSLMPWEGEESRGLKDVLRSFPASDDISTIGIFVGPEGGFSPQEIDFARQRGITPVTMGSRIMRAETAGLVAAAIALYEFGEMDGH
ncbi:MAG: RsmE family RNA methyltransferase [Dehalococcoidia bacterium]